MNRISTIVADGRSPLTQYYRLLRDAANYLPMFVNRDLEAVRMLTTIPAIDEAQLRAYRWCCYRRLAVKSGKLFKFPRVWTRRDERYLNSRLGPASGFVPDRRTDWLADRLGRLHDLRFPAVLEEARQDRTIADLGTKLESAKHAFENAKDFARRVAAGDSKRETLDEELYKINRLTIEFSDWLKRVKEHSFSMAPNLWEERLEIFRDVFPWVTNTIKEIAGLNVDAELGPGGTKADNTAFVQAHTEYLKGTTSGDERVVALHHRQNEAWEKLTNLPPLGTNEHWLAAAMAARAPERYSGPA